MTVRVAVAIQAHPSRAYLAEPLAREVGGTVVYDPDPEGFPSPWRTYRAALESTPAEATHRLILQDDVEACTGFRQAAEAALAARPEVPVSFFHGGQPTENLLALNHCRRVGHPWAEFTTYRWIPAIALALPAPLIARVLAFVDAQNWPVEFRADDEILGRALTHLGQPLHVTVPSLVQHHDLLPSLVRSATAFRPGIDPGRQAHAYIGAHDPAVICW